ncbi:phage regulatory CII family protein [uncultured Bilophila sp.]|uniref:phage regulatory CII family protein n=1 Tax=uncultured Bilophila sp. TaxID=529385 RepID=UPI00266F671A|nr:phage regulatory CII family protein [uncultured Bilophila sp.]
MNTQDYNTLTEVIEAMIDEGEKPIKAIAAEIGKPYPTLKRELNPADDGAKLGADVLLGIMRSCGSIAPLEWLADRLGYVVRRKGWSEPDRASWGEEMADVQDATGEMASRMLRHEHPSLVHNASDLVKIQLDQACTKYERGFPKVGNQ